MSRSTRTVTASIDALHQRLRAVAPHLIDDPVATTTVGELLALLADSVALTPTTARVWLLATAVAAGYPTAAEVDAVRRGLELATPAGRSGAVLSAVAVTAARVVSGTVVAEIIEGGAVVDVDFCARHRHNTGIQRVVRNTVRHWNRDAATLACWSADGTGYRRLSAAQHQLVTEWDSSLEVPVEVEGDVLLIPVNGTLLLPEVPAPALIERLSALAEYSGNRTGLIGYDMIPIVSADMVSEEESDRFAHYLSIVKHSTAVSAISDTTAEEFRGFNAALVAQGLTGPRVTSLLLPSASPAASDAIPAPRDVPLVLMVGSIEARKNQLGVLAAADRLWQEGLAFELIFVGGGGAVQITGLDREIQASRRRGAVVSHRRGVSDAQLAELYRAARLVVFPSLQEGYGLPVAEALATGTPVVTSSYGSTAEIAATGGCLLVDPRDDDEIARAMRDLLRDDELHARLVAEGRRLTSTGWSEYAAALWAQLMTEGDA